MAFPTDLEIEVAFNNDIDETNFAQSGWTSITPFVASYGGDLRGRTYERDQSEAGTLSVTLDNADNRFTPGSVQSPYYPYVKANRRFRIRGKNMLHPNVARGGSRDRDTTGFIQLNETLNKPQYDALSAPAGTSWGYGIHAMDDVSIITASAEPNAGIGQGKEKVDDGLAATKWTINTQAGWITYKLPVGVRVTRYSLTVPASNPNNNPKNWTLQGSNNGSSWTTIHTVTNNTWIGDYDSQEFTVTSPNFYLYYKLDITANIGATSNTQLAEFVIDYDDAATDLLLVDSDLTHYVQVEIPASQPLSTYIPVVSWFAPLEYGVRLAHSAYVWRISGTEPTGAKVRLNITYWDQNWEAVNDTVLIESELTSLPISTTPTQIGFSHTPPAEAKYGVVQFSVYIGGTTNSTDLVYGLTGAQSELPANLAADISGFRDQINWQLEGDGDGDYVNVGSDPTTSYLSVEWGVNDTNVFQTIGHLIPGNMYTATIQAAKISGQPDVLFTGDEGETGALINSTSFTQYTISFEAQQAEQELRFIPQSAVTAGSEGLRLRKLRIEAGDNLTLSLPVSGIDSDVTTWARPKDIFEGWVESWPARGGSTEMTITVVDRMKRLGDVELSNTLRETILIDNPKLLMPLTDSMLDTPGNFSQLGSWANENGGPSSVNITHSKGDVSAASYTTATDDGPTGEASFKNSPVGSGGNSKGYFFSIPYSKDFVPPPPVIPPKPKPKPPPVYTPVQKSTYAKRWNATWSRSYEGDNSTRFDDSPYMYQGSYDGSSPGNQKSLAGFDYKNIRQSLKGAEIVEAYFTFKNSHARWNRGLYAWVGTHSYTSKPSTWSNGSVQEQRWKKWVAEGGSLTVNIGASVGRAFRDGSINGLAIGPEDTNDHDNYGFFFGASHSARPYLTIRYRK